MKRSLIDHTTKEFETIKPNSNYELIQVLKAAKKEKDINSYAKIMHEAHRCSPYEPRSLKNLNAMFLENRESGSTGGTELELKADTINNSALNVYNAKASEYNAIINSEKNTPLKSHRFNSVQRWQYEKIIHQDLKGRIRREQRINESSRIGGYKNIKLEEPKAYTSISNWNKYLPLNHYSDAGSTSIKMQHKPQDKEAEYGSSLDLKQDIKKSNDSRPPRSSSSHTHHNDNYQTNDNITNEKLPEILLSSNNSNYTNKQSISANINQLGMQKRNSMSIRDPQVKTSHWRNDKFNELMAFTFEVKSKPSSKSFGLKHRVKFHGDSSKKVKFALPNL